jgi:DNA-binding NarL/FixJ family response regulator
MIFAATACGADWGTSCEVAMSTDLTSRERQVMRLIAKGLSNNEIGRQLNVSEATIKVHVSHIFLKLGVHKRTALAVLAARLPDEDK